MADRSSNGAPRNGAADFRRESGDFARHLRPRGLYCNRTLNLRQIRAIGYDMDYTLVHYHVALWEARAYAYVKAGLAARGWPVDDLTFDPDLIVPGLIVDTQLGNVVKADRFGYVKRAM
ncbi:MAG TPA: 5'-nucleotidase domain-containing protein, partial [Rubricoccaceae bacterium]|nr:5'-nucleotidase domain-containing protein [Rubricoccaceae bacterium]